MSTLRRIALCGFYAKNNFGDDLMAHHLSRVLSSEGRCEVQLFSDQESVSTRNGLTDQSYLDHDVIVIGGGGIVSPRFWALRKERIELLRRSQKPILFLNVNVYPNDLANEEFVNDLRSLNAQWHVRDLHSVDLLAKHGIAARWLPDISFSPDVTSPIPKAARTKKMLVFVNSYAMHGLFHKESVVEYFAAHNTLHVLAQYLDWMQSFGWQITFIPAQTSNDVDDRITAGVLRASMKKPANTEWVVEPPTHDELVKRIAQSDLVLSMRYHTTTVALAAGIPLVDVTHHAKNRFLLEELNLKAVSVEYDGLTHGQLVKATQTSESRNFGELMSGYRSTAQTCWKSFSNDWNALLNSLETQNV